MTDVYGVITFAVAVAAFCVAAATAVFVLVLRITRRHFAKERASQEERLQPALMSIIDGEGATPASTKDQRVLLEMAVRAAHHTRGADRAVLSEWLLASGIIEIAHALMASRSPVRRARGIELYLPLAEINDAPLKSMLSDRDPRVRVLACESLGRAAALPAIADILDATTSARIPASVAAMAITRMVPRRADLLLNYEITDAPHTTQLVIELVGTLNLIDGRAAMEKCLSDPLPEIRVAALRTLGRLGHPASTSALENFAPLSPEEAVALAEARNGVLGALQ